MHAREIELSLERVKSVYQTLYPDGVPYKVISIAGTNGKGSTAEMLSSIYTQSGWRVGKFTSPHLVRFNERFSINGELVSDADLIEAFERIEAARADVPITFFEYGALLAMVLFAHAQVDVAVMEVGLGGRLDAVNSLDADVAIITSIALDHTAWLGNTLDKIAFEKAGIARAKSPCVIGVAEPQDSMLAHLNAINAVPFVVNQEFSYSHDDNSWTYELHKSGNKTRYAGLPLPFAQGGVQLSNASLAITAALLLSDTLPVSQNSIEKGLAAASIAGRCQVMSEKPLVVLDVSHNEASVSRLARFLSNKLASGLNSRPSSRRLAKVIGICGMLEDKEIEASLKCISGLIDDWHFVTINNDRGSSSAALAEKFEALQPQNHEKKVFLHQNVKQAYLEVQKTLNDDDCVVIFGSFFVVGDIISHIDAEANAASV